MATRLTRYLGCGLTIKGGVPWTVFIVNFVPTLILIRYDIFLAIMVGFTSFAILSLRKGRRRLPYPPGPRRLPILGNLFSVPSQEEWITYQKWPKDCGMTGRPVQARCIHRFVLSLAYFQDLTLYMST